MKKCFDEDQCLEEDVEIGIEKKNKGNMKEENRQRKETNLLVRVEKINKNKSVRMAIYFDEDKKVSD